MKTLKVLAGFLFVWMATLSPCSAYRDPETDTFLTRDPAGFVDGPNLYAYVKQNPWTHWDPLGLAVETDNAWLRKGAEYQRKFEKQGGVGNFIASAWYNGWGAIRGGVSATGQIARTELPAAIQQSKANIARDEASGSIDGVQTALARAGLFFAEGMASPITVPANVDRIPAALANLGPQIGADAANMVGNPSVSAAADLVEDAMVVMGLTKIAASASSMVGSSARVTVIGSRADVAKYSAAGGYNVFEPPSWMPGPLVQGMNKMWFNRALNRGDKIVLATDPVAHGELMKKLDKSSTYLDMELPMLEKSAAPVQNGYAVRSALEPETGASTGN